MDIYHVFCDLQPEVSDTSFSDAMARYMGHLHAQDLITGWRLMRRKLGLGAPDMGEFHLMIEVKNLAQLDAAFQQVTTRDEPIEGLHHGINSLVRNASFALYRDFPDAVRQRGAEKF
jgi:hypothetical protein